MISSIALLAAAASFVSASSPPGFQPAVRNDLVVDFNSTLIDGQVVAKNLVANQPTFIGTTQRLTGNSFTVIMIDLDIPTNTAGQTSTLLHWMQTGLALSPQASRIGRIGGSNAEGSSSNAIQIAFLLRNTTGQAPAAPYISPNPPARLPLSHTYAQFLVDTSGLSAQSTAMQTLMTAAQTRQGFNLQTVLQQAGLTNRLVAANFFNVTNPGPVQTSTGSGAGASTGTGTGTSTGTGTTTSNGNGNGQQQQQGSGSSSSSTGSSSGESSSSTSSTSSTTYGNGGSVSDSSGNTNSNTGASTSSSSASGNNVVKASDASSLSVVSGSVAVLAGVVAMFIAL
ncbi:hypothetical protein Sste5346_008917 [Sporothrix stenoceras]|uniref:Phosphatidylethanolamine-binding protein n=1 Tax=Sporothrix stenoceras TaxID=5173 RepID=A0ABR3YM87_9PEZI